MIAISILLITSSLVLFTAIERQAVRLLARPLTFARRWLIPLPVFGLLALNWLEIERCLLFSRPRGQASDTDWIGLLLLALIAVHPFLLVGWGKNGWRLLPRVWLGHFVFMFVYALHLLSTGVPLRD